jgi:CxxC-x17-CxxC domain-containing protein
MEKNEINFFGLTTFRNARKRFGIKTDDRRRHFYCIGKTGMGKSNLMENMAIQDIQAGHGIAYVDPHGEGAEKLLDFIPAKRINDVVYFNPADLDYPIAFNVMEKVDFKYRHLVAGGLMGVFKKVWPDVWSARMEYILNNSILALLEYPDATLLGVNRMLADPEYREKVVSKVTDPIVRSFWLTEYARYTQRYEIEATAAIQNKVGQFISNPLIRNIIGQTKSTISMRDIMDQEKVFIMDLSKGRIGEDNSRLLGALLITKLQLAAMSRVDIAEEERKDFYLYVDEFQNFATESFSNILSEARKYRLNIILGHQYINQMEEEVRDAVFGNVGTLAVFRVGAEDAEFLEREFSPEFTAEDLVNLPKYNVYLKLMIDGISGSPFSAETLPPQAPLEESSREKIIKASRERYSISKEIVEDKISRWSGFGQEEVDKKIGSDFSQTKNINFKGNNSQPKNSFGQPEGTTLYDAVCSKCGKATKVIFPPEKGRTVYCKSCLKKIKNPKETHPEILSKSKALDPSINTDAEQKESKIENISFSDRRRDKDEKKPFYSDGENQKFSQKRKEINLSELRKALEESLEKKEEKKPDEIKEINKILPEITPEKSLEEQLKEKIEQKKKDDELKKIEEQDNNKKGKLKPGQKIKL